MRRGRYCVLRLEIGSKTRRALFTRPYRKTYTNNYPNIETYVKFSSILNRLIPRKHSKFCPMIGFKSTIEISIFTCKPMGSWFSVVPPLRAHNTKSPRGLCKGFTSGIKPSEFCTVLVCRVFFFFFLIHFYIPCFSFMKDHHDRSSLSI